MILTKKVRHKEVAILDALRVSIIILTSPNYILQTHETSQTFPHLLFADIYLDFCLLTVFTRFYLKSKIGFRRGCVRPQN